MSNILELFGVKREKPKFDIFKNIFFFIQEFHINPLPEEYEIIPVYCGDKIVKLNIKKLAMDMDVFNRLMEERNEFHERQNKEYEKASRKR